MARPKDKSWCDNIVLPSGAGSLSDGLSYLDRMIAGGDPSQRQFMTLGSKTHGANQNKANKKNNTIPIRKFGDKRQLECKPLDVNIDEETWIADRKKKFPKIKSLSHKDDSHPTSHGPVSINPPRTHLDENASGVVSLKEDSKSNQRGRPIRKMTLFEKLTQMDDQSS